MKSPNNFVQTREEADGHTTSQHNILNRNIPSFATILAKEGIEAAGSSRIHTLKSKLGNEKDPKKEDEKSGIYKISCEDCPCTYVGQTKRLVNTRIKEHLKEADLIKWGRKMHINSAVARHMVEHDHKMVGVTVLKEVKSNKLDPYESFFIGKEPQEHDDLGNAHSYPY